MTSRFYLLSSLLATTEYVVNASLAEKSCCYVDSTKYVIAPNPERVQ